MLKYLGRKILGLFNKEISLTSMLSQKETLQKKQSKKLVRLDNKTTEE